uniref:golgin subfamily A member 2-like isoform X2 n=1 Tax=Myxine glutinosa TaxID=7769 RepID=UPI00358F09F0
MEVCSHVPKNLLPLAATKQRPIPFELGGSLNRKSTSGCKKDDNGSHKRNGFIALPANDPQENGQVLNGRSCGNQDSTSGQDLCDHDLNGIDDGNCSNFAELEVKLCNLAIELEANTMDNAKLSARVLELKQQASCLAEELQKVLRERKEQEEKHMEQRAAVRQQLEVQIQTISVLVAEKHDLLTSLKHTQRAAEQKACEAQDLASRLHASHRHVVELEQSLATAASYHRHFEHLSMQLQKEKEECKMESNRLKKDREDLRQQTSELSERLKSKQHEAENAQAQLLEVQRKLELSELNIQQLSSDLGAADSTSQLQIAQEQVQNLELRLEQAEEAARQLGAERDRLMQQLQESSANWQEHAIRTTQQMRELVHEKDVSIARIEELQSSLAELQEQIDMQTQQKMAAAEALMEQEMSVERSLQKQLKTTEAERDELLALYKLQDAQLSELKSDLEMYREQTHDHKVLLEDKQSDKATISKALSQNKQLKQEVEDLQFILAAVSSENRETLTTLEAEQHGRQKVETELEDLRKRFESLTSKLVDKSSMVNVDSSEHELENSITHLLYQRDQLARQCQMQNEVVDLLRIESSRDRQENYQLRDSLFVLNSEMGKWKEKSEALQKQVNLISQERQQLRSNAGNDNEPQGLRLLQDEAYCHNHYDLQTAMDKLQEKFLTIMQDKVELMDRNELLEYNYSELSKKTKTLGEYVTFYMRHCEILSQRHEEQRNSVMRLQKDNASLTTKVNELRSFVDPLSANESHSSMHCSTTKRTDEVSFCSDADSAFHDQSTTGGDMAVDGFHDNFLSESTHEQACSFRPTDNALRVNTHSPVNPPSASFFYRRDGSDIDILHI